MQTVFFFKNTLPMDEDALREYFLTKVSKLEKILSHFSDDGVNLQVKCEKFHKHSAYEVELTMKLPGETLTSREASHAITKAVDLAKDRLMLQLKKSIMHMRRAHRNIKARRTLKMQIATPG